MTSGSMLVDEVVKNTAELIKLNTAITLLQVTMDKIETNTKPGATP